VYARGGGGLFYGGGGGYNQGSGGMTMGAGGAAGQGASQAQKGRRLVHVAVVSPAESIIVTLVAVCADGRRVYFTTLPAGAERMGFPGMGGAPAAAGNAYSQQGLPGGGGNGNVSTGAIRLVPASCRLAVCQSRDPPPQGSAQRGMTSAQALRATTTVRSLEVEAAYYGDGLMLLCDATDRDDDARLFMAARDLTLPPHMQVRGQSFGVIRGHKGLSV